MTLLDRIDETSRARLAARRVGDAAEVARLTKLIDDLYDQRRREGVEAIYGPREKIVAQARIEVELERIAASR
jgi:predicted ATPase